MPISFRRFLPIDNVSREDCSSDNEYWSKVSLSLCLPENRAAAMKLLAEDIRSLCFRVSVEGYNTSLTVDEIKFALVKHFNIACQGIFDVVVPVDPVTNLPNRRAFMYLEGTAKGMLALALNGSDAGGWRATVKHSPAERECVIDEDQAIYLRTAYHFKQCATPIWVEGYDILLPEMEVKEALIKHFCPIGVIADLTIFRDPLKKTLTRMAFLYFYKEEEVEGALALNGTDAGGWTVIAKHLPHLETVPKDHGLYHC